MNMTKKNLSTIILLLIATGAMACTTVIVSGKATVDGRPLMLKQRDSGNTENVYIYAHPEGKHAYVGVTSLRSKRNREVYYGQNECGLALMNSTSYNLDAPIEGRSTKGNIIRLGLENCATVDEFGEMLERMKPFAYGSNYGCFDAEGNIAYFECGANGVKKYDANDPAVAPDGYIVRANFGYSGPLKEGKGYSRYAQASAIMEQAIAQQSVSWRTLLGISRCLQHGLTHINLYDYMPADENTDSYVHFTDYIPRSTTASCVVLQGVKEGESPLLTTAWTAISHPLTTVAVPVWFMPEEELPLCVRRDTNYQCPLINWSTQLKRYLWTMDYGEGENYIMLSHLINKAGTGILQQIQPIEATITERGEQLLDGFRKKNRIDTKKLQKYYQWVDTYVDEEYQQIVRSHPIDATPLQPLGDNY